MRYRYIFLLGFMLLGTSCERSEELVAPPTDLLSKDQMVSILIDLHLAEAKMSYTGSRKADSIEIIFRNYERAIFDEHSVADSTYFVVTSTIWSIWNKWSEYTRQ